MPRRRTGTEAQAPRMNGALIKRLTEELRSEREAGQPIIYEREYSPKALGVTVVWDKWDRLPLEERTEIILRAYEQAEGPGARERIALASGLTVPEAHASGMLPFEIITALRKSDPVTAEQCREAMLEEGATTLLEPERPRLWFATREEAEAAQKRLVQRLPRSDDVWLVTQEMGSVEDWSQR